MSVASSGSPYTPTLACRDLTNFEQIIPPFVTGSCPHIGLPHVNLSQKRRVDDLAIIATCAGLIMNPDVGISSSDASKAILSSKADFPVVDIEAPAISIGLTCSLGAASCELPI